MVTRHILEQTGRNSDDLAAIKSRLDPFERRFGALERKLDGLDLKVNRLRRDPPSIIADAMRKVLKERDERR
jgi:hypothetical protein